MYSAEPRGFVTAMTKERDANVPALRILSILPVLGQPRNSKRIKMLRDADFEVKALVFEREVHAGRPPDCEVQLLPHMSRGGYLKRVPALLSALPKIRDAAQSSDLIYASGQDMGIVAVMACLGLKKPIVIEIGDTRRFQVAAGLPGWLIRRVDKVFMDSCSLLVVTAHGFVDDYYRQWLKTSIPSLILENKLEPTGNEPLGSTHTESVEDRLQSGQPLRVGYFGVLRCGWSWQVLKELAAAHPQGIEVVISGIAITPVDLGQQCEALDNITFLGEFRSPEDLPELYKRVDLVWGCYPHPEPGDWNWRWARTNRFYESCFYKTPIVSLKDSGDSASVELHNIGLIVERGDVTSAVDRLGRITAEELGLWQDNMRALPNSVYTYSTETNDLKCALEALVEPTNRPV